MSRSDEIQTNNILLAALSPDDRALLARDVTRVPLPRDLVLVSADRPVDHVYFPEDGVTSVVADMPDSGRTEVGIFGRDGMSASFLLLGADRSPHGTFVQVAGRSALRIDADRFLAAVDESATLRIGLLRYVQAFVIQTAQSAATNAHHRIESRLARWLLMVHDRLDTDEIPLTHEFMGMMIAAERSGVTVTLHILEGAGMIRSKRGRVIILDRDKLTELAGDSYGLPEAEYRRLIGPFGGGGRLKGSGSVSRAVGPE
ncbi:MAG TPA: Crp/Fnr family transcriptional regulator [Sphingomonas sp.]|uniref:Crp/Fnr family transcriptional regulator n=1 Tax=Sphingomonas sp. TaxID=28214 RepID=UPI002ED9991D